MLRDERALLARDVDAMKKRMSEVAATASGALGAQPDPSSRDPGGDDEVRDVEFSRMERERRERAADERLEELKKKMRG